MIRPGSGRKGATVSITTGPVSWSPDVDIFPLITWRESTLYKKQSPRYSKTPTSPEFSQGPPSPWVTLIRPSLITITVFCVGTDCRPSPQLQSPIRLHPCLQDTLRKLSDRIYGIDSCRCRSRNSRMKGGSAPKACPGCTQGLVERFVVHK